MKELTRVAGLMFTAAVAYGFGWWLWENVLEDEVDELYDKHQKKKLKRFM
jgi:hypothetical protein